jgi:hypothetical protein
MGIPGLMSRGLAVIPNSEENVMKRLTRCGIAYAILFLAASGFSQVAVLSSVVLGSDYLATVPGASAFPGLGTLNGVPLGPATGNTNIIVQRQADAIFPGSPPATAPSIRAVLTTLQLVTSAPVNFAGNGIDNYFMNLTIGTGRARFRG